MRAPSFLLLAVAILAHSVPAEGALTSPFTLGRHLDNDIIIPSPKELKARATAVRVLPGPASGEGERVSYRSLLGETYELTRFRGRHVDVFLPDTWTEPGALSLEMIRAFVDRTDLIYQHFLDLTGAHPGGEGPLPVAIVPSTCGFGCGLLGFKGVEMEDDPGWRSTFWQEIAADIPSGVIVHELTHNFDLFSQYVAYTPDWAHAWTSFISYYYSVYAWEGYLNMSPDDVAANWLATADAYFRNPGADWESCVRNGPCEDHFVWPELAWGGFGFRLALREGPQAVRGFLSFLRAYRQGHQPPRTLEEQNDLYLEALAAGARRNLSCVADAWRWPVSDALRERMRRSYGAVNPFCQDLDRDGFSPALGDCDDRRAAVRPGAPERLRRVDDDCDGLVDETVWRETAGADFPPRPRLTLPAEIDGSTPGVDVDVFSLHLPAPARVKAEVCSSFQAGLTLIDDAGKWENVFAYGGGCTREFYALEAGNWNAELFAGGAASNYQVVLEKLAPWPEAPWARTPPPQRRGDRLVLTAVTALRRPPGPGAQVRFWVSGHGIVGTVPYSRAASFTWAPPPGVDPVAEGLTWRVQLLVRGVPAATITRPQPFAAP